MKSGRTAEVAPTVALDPNRPFRTGAMDSLACQDHDRRSEMRGAVMDLGSWLRGLGLDQYEAAFRENEIDAAVLPNPTAEDLKDLGVGIVEFCRGPQPQPAAQTEKRRQPLLGGTPQPTDRPQHRQKGGAAFVLPLKICDR
jgi:SAM domain (Sterile alpha motif)